MSMEPKQILILGGGFAGVYTARYLEKMLRPEEANITLVNRENYWVYQPMLSEVISGSIGLPMWCLRSGGFALEPIW